MAELLKFYTLRNYLYKGFMDMLPHAVPTYKHKIALFFLAVVFEPNWNWLLDKANPMMLLYFNLRY